MKSESSTLLRVLCYAFPWYWTPLQPCESNVVTLQVVWRKFVLGKDLKAKRDGCGNVRSKEELWWRLLHNMTTFFVKRRDPSSLTEPKIATGVIPFYRYWAGSWIEKIVATCTHAFLTRIEMATTLPNKEQGKYEHSEVSPSAWPSNLPWLRALHTRIPEATLMKGHDKSIVWTSSKTLCCGDRQDIRATCYNQLGIW